METRPEISVVLPVFAGERYLRTSIDSVLEQSFKHFELLVWDDASPDASVDIVKTYADSRLKLFTNVSNLGLFRTLNLAIQQSRGRFIKLWSQDDVMKPNCLQISEEFLEANEFVGMAYSAYDVIDGQGRLIKPAPSDCTPEIIEPVLAAQIMFYHGSITGNIANVILRRSALDDVGMFREDMIVSGDFEMWVRLSRRWPLGFIREATIRLRSHEGQFSRRKGIYVQFIREDRLIVQTLASRLPVEIKEHAKLYEIRHRQVQYLHYFMRCLVAGDWHTALLTYKEITKTSQPGLLLALWLLTLNQRLFRMKPRYVQLGETLS